MNLPVFDMPGREKGFWHKGERLAHVCSVSEAPAHHELILFAQVDQSNGNAIVWKTDLEGKLESTVQFIDGAVARVPNEQFRPAFEAEKFIFLTRMRMQQETQ